MSKFAGIHVGFMKLRHIDLRLTAQIVEMNLFHVCTTRNQCSVIFSIELLFCKKQFFPVDIDAPTVHIFLQSRMKSRLSPFSPY